MFDSQSSDEHSSVQTVLARPQGGATLTGVTYVDDDPSDAETYDDGEEHHVTEAGEKPRDLDDVTAAADGWADVVEPEVDYVYATPRRTSAEDKEKDAAATADSLYPVTSTERPLSSTERPVSSCVTDNNSLRNGAVNLYEEPGESFQNAVTGNSRPNIRPPLPPSDELPAEVALAHIDDDEEAAGLTVFGTPMIDIRESSPLNPVQPSETNGIPLIRKAKEKGKVKKKYSRSSLSGVLSVAYGLVLVVSAFVLTTAAYIGRQPSMASVFPAAECFYIYLLAVSLTCLMYVCLCMSSSDVLPISTDTTIVENGVVDHYSVVKGADHVEGSLLRQWTKKNCNSRSQCTSFYLRLAAAVLGIMSMVQASLEIGELLHLGVLCMPIAEVVRSVLHLTFTFVQLYTILLGAQTAVMGSVMPLFAYSHLIATNLSVLMRSCIVETIRDTAVRDAHDSLLRASDAELTVTSTAAANVLVNVTESDMQAAISSVHDCYSSDIMRRVVTVASPYLYTYQMQYSLIVSGVLIAMWIRVNSWKPTNQHQANPQRRSYISRPISTIEDAEPDCVTMPNYGLFLGLITLIGVVITAVVYFVLVNDHRYQYGEIATLLLASVELLLSVSTLVTMAIGSIVWSSCRGDDKGTVVHSFDDILLTLSIVGILIFEGMKMVSLFHIELSYLKYFVFSSAVTVSIQALVQCICIRVWVRQCTDNRSGRKSRQVIRQCVAFLLLANLAFYVMTVSIQQSRTETSQLGTAIRKFYGDLGVASITRVLTSNLSPLYRLSSVVCLAHLWNRLSSL